MTGRRAVVVRLVCGAWGDRTDSRLPADWPMPPACNLTAGHAGPHRGSFGIAWSHDGAAVPDPPVQLDLWGGDA